MIRNFDDLTKALMALIDFYYENVSKDSREWADLAKVDPKARYMRAVNRTYSRAKYNAEKFGFVGVGTISFAEHRMVRFQERVARKLAA